MIRGPRLAASAFAIATVAGVLSTSVVAADLGGNCCADLEDRVAELEATTVRRGGRRVSLTLSGHVNETLLFWDDGSGSGTRVVTNDFSMTRFSLRGSVKFNSDWSAGFYIELGLARTGLSSDVDQESGSQYGGYGPGPGIRHQALYIQSKQLGTFWLGHTTDSADKLIDICVGCPITSSGESEDGWGDFLVNFGGFYPGVTWVDLGVGQEGYFATRTSVLKYISPSFFGFSLSGSIHDADDGTAEGLDRRNYGYDWDVALRYTGEFNSFRLVGGATWNQVSVDRDDYNSWAIVGSAMHVPTGLYFAANYRNLDVVGCSSGGSFGQDCTDKAWQLQIGMAKKFHALGLTTIWLAFNKYDTGFRSFILPNASTFDVQGTDGKVWAFGINQKIDAAEMELYLTYWNISADVTEYGDDENPTFSPDDLNVIMAGARIKF